MILSDDFLGAMTRCADARILPSWTTPMFERIIDRCLMLLMLIFAVMMAHGWLVIQCQIGDLRYRNGLMDIGYTQIFLAGVPPEQTR